jgi:hypothetical protein
LFDWDAVDRLEVAENFLYGLDRFTAMVAGIAGAVLHQDRAACADIQETNSINGLAA